MTKGTSGYFDDNDGTGINPDLVSKPSLCVSCKKDTDPVEERLCALARAEQQGEEEFRCFAYLPKESDPIPRKHK